MDGQKIFKTPDFLFLVTLNNRIKFNGADRVFECLVIEFQWERFRLEFFHMYPNLSLCVWVCVG